MNRFFQATPEEPFTCRMSCPNLSIYFSVVWGNCRTVLSSRLGRTMSYIHVVLTKPRRSNTETTKLPCLSKSKEAGSILQGHRCLSRRTPDYLYTKFMRRDSIYSIFANHPLSLGVKQFYLNVSCTNSPQSSCKYSAAKLYNDPPSSLKSCSQAFTFL